VPSRSKLAGSGTFEGIMMMSLSSRLTPSATSNAIPGVGRPEVSISINGVPVKPGSDVPSMVSEVVTGKMPEVKTMSNGPRQAYRNRLH